jgi:hypothetical protein
MRRSICLLAASLATVAWADPPVVYWASDPVRPGEVVVVQGGQLGSIVFRRSIYRTPQ